MYRKVILSLLGALFVSQATFGQQQEKGPKVGEYAPDIEAKEWILGPGDEVPSLAELRGLVVVLVFWTSFHDGGEMVLPYINMYANNESIGTAGGIFTIGVTDADFKTTEPLVRKKQVFFPVGTGAKNAATDYGFDQSWGVVIINTEGKIAFKGQPQDMNGWLTQVQTLLQKSPPWRTHPSEARKVHEKLDEARRLIAEEKYSAASKAVNDALERAVTGDKIKSEAMSLIDLMDLIGYEKLSHVSALIDAEDFKRAAEICRQVERRFRGLDVYKDAKKRADALSKDHDKFKTEWEQYSDEGKAFTLFVDARKSLKQKDVGEAWEKLSKIVNSFPNTEMAEKAQLMIDRMKANPVIWGHVTDFQAKGARDFMAQAKSLEQAGRCKEAKDLYNRVMKEFRDSIYADQAKDALSKLPC